MATAMFADTAGWACLADKDEEFHAAARSIYSDVTRRSQRVITTSLVLCELVALLTSRGLPRRQMISFIETIQAAPHVEVVFIDSELQDRAWQLLKARPDKEWSLADCASFVVMQQRGLTDALTTDHHFEQAGFTRLLR